MFYHYDVDKWIIHLLPPILRKASIYAFLRSMLYPVKQLQAAFLSCKAGVDQTLTYNAFTDYLERFLNNLFFFEYKAIYITDIDDESVFLAYSNESADPVFMSFESESDPAPLVLSSQNPNLVSGQFIVHVPAALSQQDIATVYNWVNYYKMAGTVFLIKVYE